MFDIGESLDGYVHRVFAALPEFVREHAILAGGALRSYHDGTPVKDFDLFFRAHATYEVAAAVMDREFTRGDSSVALAPTFIVPSLEAPVNLVGFRHLGPAQLVESFDFTACAMAAWLEPNAQGGVGFVYAQGAVDDAQAKQLNINRVRPTKRLLKRSARYIEKYGYLLTDQFVERMRESFDAIDDEGEPDHSS